MWRKLYSYFSVFGTLSCVVLFPHFGTHVIVKLFKEQMGFSSRFKTSRTPFFLLLFCAPKQVVTSVYLNTAALSYAYAVIKNIARQKKSTSKQVPNIFLCRNKNTPHISDGRVQSARLNKVKFVTCAPRVSFSAPTKCSQRHKICLIKKTKEL